MAIGTVIANAIVKPLVGAQAPLPHHHLAVLQVLVDAGVLPAGGYSFPSGHTTAAMSFAAALFLCLPGGWMWLAFLIPIAMGFTPHLLRRALRHRRARGHGAGAAVHAAGLFIFHRLLLWDAFADWANSASIV